jgi:hypothetical protein
MNNCLSIIIVFLIIIFVNLPHSSKACTVFSAANDDYILAAANKDWDNIKTRILFLPSSDGKYGRVYFGYQVPGGFQNVGGMNDQGLWYDGASLPERSDIRNHYNKPTVKGELCEKALEECASVDEVIAMYETYFTPHWQGHSMWADKYGNSVIIEFGEKDVVFIHKKGNYQLMTDFYVSDSANARWYNSYRFNVASHILSTNTEISNSLFSSILDAVHQTGMNPTVYSNIYDLKNGEIYTFNFHNYDEFVKINLAEQLSMGEQYYKLPSLFSQIKLSEPAPGAEIDPSSVTFIWNGDAQTYNLYCSENPDFSGCVPIEINEDPASEKYPIKFSSISLTVFLLGFIFRRYKKALLLLITFLPIIFLSCELDIITSPYKSSEIEHTRTIENLKAKTEYYWKIVAIGENGINSESLVEDFQTK